MITNELLYEMSVYDEALVLYPLDSNLLLSCINVFAACLYPRVNAMHYVGNAGRNWLRALVARFPMVTSHVNRYPWCCYGKEQCSPLEGYGTNIDPPWTYFIKGLRAHYLILQKYRLRVAVTWNRDVWWDHGPVLISEKTSYYMIWWSLEAAGFEFRIARSLSNLTGASAALLSRFLSNVEAMR